MALIGTKSAPLLAVVFFSCAAAPQADAIGLPARWRKLEAGYRFELDQAKNIYSALRARFHAIAPIDPKEVIAFASYERLRSALLSYEGVLVRLSLLLDRHERSVISALRRRDPARISLALKSASADFEKAKPTLRALSADRASVDAQLLAVAQSSKEIQQKRERQKAAPVATRGPIE